MIQKKETKLYAHKTYENKITGQDLIWPPYTSFIVSYSLEAYQMICNKYKYIKTHTQTHNITEVYMTKIL